MRDGWPTSLADYLGYEDMDIAPSSEGDDPRAVVYRVRMQVRPEHVAPNGFLQATVVVGLADLCCARGTFATIPDDASFTTLELKTNLISTTRDGAVVCEARLQHGGRTTQVWDAVALHEESGRTLALFRCTQLVLYPGARGG